MDKDLKERASKYIKKNKGETMTVFTAMNIMEDIEIRDKARVLNLRLKNEIGEDFIIICKKDYDFIKKEVKYGCPIENCSIHSLYSVLDKYEDNGELEEKLEIIIK
jgi:hypothetical protein